MIEKRFSREALLIGEEAMARLENAHVAIFGVGGVGGYTVEALARSGIGKIDLIDNDVVDITNINRQIYALESTVGKYKVEVAKERIGDINPKAEVKVYKVFFMPDTCYMFDFSQYDYVVDAIDTVTAKIELAVRANEAGVPIISAMGAGNKTDPSRFEVADIYKTSVCPLARVMRKELRERNVKKLKVVYSKEEPVIPQPAQEGVAQSGGKRSIPGSTAFVPAAAGIIIAGEVVRDIIAAESV